MAVPEPANNSSVLEIIAYSFSQSTSMPIVPAPNTRDWMDQTRIRYSYRCLPMVSANQAGWFLLNDYPLEVSWNGEEQTSALQIVYAGDVPEFRASSMFGYGILTFTIPYLFRTPEGYNLLARGPANRPKDGICALEGIIETDWAVASFTMNWKLTRPGQVVRFEKGDPVCMIVPQKRGELEAFHPRFAPISSEPELAQAHRTWAESRAHFSEMMRSEGVSSASESWQKHYYKGTSPSGHSGPEHQTKLVLREFADDHPRDQAAIVSS